MMTKQVSVARLARTLGIERYRLFALAGKVDRMYHHWRISNHGKRRLLSEPAHELKQIQRALTDKILCSLPVSSASFSVKGGGVIRGALQHRCTSNMCVLDLQNCFPATGVRLVRAALMRAGLTEEAAKLVTRLVTVKGALPQGAPTSSMILDIVLYDVDQQLIALAEQYGARYTRYADDLCFSGPRELSGLAQRARRILRGHEFRTNERKTRITGPADQHLVTGIVVTDELNPRPGYIPTLTAKLKDAKRSANQHQVDSLRGQVAWVTSVNPLRGHRLFHHNRLLLAPENSGTPAKVVKAPHGDSSRMG
jgi:RNA-directed DNA polymerase